MDLTTNQTKSQQFKLNVGFLERGENRSTRGQTSQTRAENQQTQGGGGRSGNRTLGMLTKASAITTAPTLLSTLVPSNMNKLLFKCAAVSFFLFTQRTIRALL